MKVRFPNTSSYSGEGGGGGTFDGPGTKSGFTYPYLYTVGSKILSQPEFVGTATMRFDFTCGPIQSTTHATQNIQIYVLPEGWHVPDTAAQVRGLEQARSVLQRNQQKMLAAVGDLKDRNKAFCEVTSLMLGKLPSAPEASPPFIAESDLIGHVWDFACDAIPTGVKGAVDADRKIAANAQLIEKLNQEISSLQDSATLVPRSVDRATAVTSPPLSAARSQTRSPLTTLAAARSSALAGIRAMTNAVAGNRLGNARALARTASSRLLAVSRACVAATSYLNKSGIGGRISKAQVPCRPPARSARSPAAREGGPPSSSKPSQLLTIFQQAKAVPTSEVTDLRVSDVVCDRRLNAFDKALASSFRTLADDL